MQPHSVQPPLPMEMESESSMAVAGDFTEMDHPPQQQPGSFTHQYPGPPPLMGPPTIQMGPPPIMGQQPVQMGLPPLIALAPDPMGVPPLMGPTPIQFGPPPVIERNEDDEFACEPPHEFNQIHHRHVNELIGDEDSGELERLATNNPRALVNLMGDPLLSVVISCRKTQIALKLIGLPHCDLEIENYDGDTALHVAARVGDRKVAKALLIKCPRLAEKRNKKGETPLHKAALYGQTGMFFLLVTKGKSSPEDRTHEGATALHCAIMGNAQGLALKIATRWPHLAMSRNNAAVTPLQLLVTIPEAFRSQLVLGTLDSLLYNWIPLAKDSRKGRVGDVEDENSEEETEKAEDEEMGIKAFRSKFPSKRKTYIDLVELTVIMPGRWIHLLFYKILSPIHIFLFKLLNRVSLRIRRLCKLKETHRDAKKLIECLASYRGYFGYFIMSQSREFANATSSRQVSHDDQETKTLPQSVDKAPKAKSSVRNWSEPPLIMGAEMGLHEFVTKILQVCPESAAYLDSHGRNVLQAAIGSGSWEIVEFIRRNTAGDNPVLPSWLLSDTMDRRTILHFASERIPPKTDDAVQLQEELLFFEKVKGMVPMELLYNRNKEEKTAQEVFDEIHKAMFQSCKNELMDMGKTCAGLVAAVVFASGFSIPDEKDEKTGNPVYMNRLPFKIFSHSYVIGLSCATTSLVLFLSLVIAPYKEQQFQQAIPIKYFSYFLACLSFVMALLALLVSFTCNFFLQIYSGQRTESGNLIPLILELTVFPALCFILLLCYKGTTFWPVLRRIWK